MEPHSSGVVVSATASAMPVLTFRNFSLRCDKADPQVSFHTPWNWELTQGKKIALITTNSFLNYQLIAGFAGLVPPLSGEIISNGPISWPVGGEGGLDRRLRISQAIDFLSTVYRDCLEKSRVSIEEFWQLMSRVGVHRRLLIKELSRDQREFFYFALSLLFAFDCYLIEKSKALTLLSDSYRPLRALFRRQIEGKTLITTSTSKRFLREFCSDGLVLGPCGQILFAGELSKAVQWADQNLGDSETIESGDASYEMDLQFRNDETPDEFDIGI